MNDPDSAAEQKQQSQGGVPATPQNLPSTQPATEQQLYQAEQKIEERMSAFERSTIRLTKIGLFVGIVTLIIFAGQLWEMYEGGEQTDKLVGYAKTQANSTGDQADAAQQFSDTAEDINGRMSDAVDQLGTAAKNAKAGIRATQDAMRLDQRAWIVWKAIEGKPELDKPWTLKTYFTNSGKTPAKNVRVNCIVDHAKDESALDFNKIAPETRPAIIAPNDPTTYCELNPLKIDKVHQEVLNIFSSKQEIIFFYGFVTYDDIFRREHWLTFCHAMEPDGKTWDTCHVYNDTGDGKKPKWKQQKAN